MDNEFLLENKIVNSSKKIETAKQMAQYEILHGIFYKYMFKAMQYNKINIIFFYSSKSKILQFEDISKEEKFKELFYDNISQIIQSKDRFEIRLSNESIIRFVYASESARGYRYHYAIVDTNTDKEIFNDVVKVKGILFDMDKKEKGLTDNYNIEFVEM